MSLASPDPCALFAEFRASGVDTDEPVGGDGEVPVLFFFGDGDGNQLLVSEERRGAGGRVGCGAGPQPPRLERSSSTAARSSATSARSSATSAGSPP